MTTLLQKAFEKASSLPEQEQNRFARFMISEIDTDREWDASFAGSQDELALMAKEAIAEYKAGRTKPLDPSRDF